MGLLYWFGTTDTILTNPVKWPMFDGFLIGLIMGDMPKGLAIGAAIELIFIVNISGGGNLPADKCVAAFISIPIAIHTGMDVETALSIAIPMATLSTPLDNLRRIIAVGVHKAVDREIDNLNIPKMKFLAWFAMPLIQLPLRMIPVTLLLYFGADAAASVIANIPPWIAHSLAALGKIVPAVGMVAVVRLIGKASMIPYFLIGFYAYKTFGLSVMVIAVLAGCLAFLVVSSKQTVDFSETAALFRRSAESGKDVDHSKDNFEHPISVKALKSTRFKGVYAHRLAQDMENYYATGFCLAAQPCLEDIYGHDPEAYKAALHRWMVPYITEVTWGACINGAAIAMEEQIGNGAPIDPSSVVAMRTGLMGPFAGFGDTINGTIIKPIINSIAINMCQNGNPLGAFLGAFWPFVFQNLVVGYNTFMLGYRLGKESLMLLLKGGWIETIMEMTSILGMTMMGAMTAQYVKIATTLKIQIFETTYKVQDWIDKLLPGLLPLVIFFVSYWYMGKEKSSNIKLIAIYFVIAVVGALINLW